MRLPFKHYIYEEFHVYDFPPLMRVQSPGPYLVVLGKDPHRPDAEMFWYSQRTRFPCYLGQYSRYRIDRSGILYNNDQMMQSEVVESPEYTGPKLKNVQNLSDAAVQRINERLFGDGSSQQPPLDSPITKENAEKNSLYWVIVALIIIILIGVTVYFVAYASS